MGITFPILIFLGFYFYLRYKDAKKDEPYTTWHENGQKESEFILKDGSEKKNN